MICAKCYKKNNDRIKLGLIALYNNDLFLFSSLEELKNGLFLINNWPPNFEIIQFSEKYFKSKEEGIKEMMGENYETNINKIHSILCCKSNERHIIGFTKKPKNREIKDFYFIVVRLHLFNCFLSDKSCKAF